MNYTKSSPCRCGFDGEGQHRCHFGRPDPHGTGEDGSDWCCNPAGNKFLATWGSLPGMQPKVSAVAAHYCPEHMEELRRQLGLTQFFL